MLYSYDIFDTVLTRRTANPHGIFAIMQDKLKSSKDDIPTEVRENFYELRIQGERLARYSYCKGNCEEITLAQIYQTMNTTRMLTDSMVEELIGLECETEIENIIPVPVIVKKIQEHLKKKEDVIFISDMYLDKEVVYQLLEKADEQFRNIPLYLSSDIGKTKRSGKLFQFIQEEWQVSFCDWQHTGDNSISDISVPEKLGIRVNQVPNRKLLPLEKAILENDEDDVSFQLLVGISKNARILNELKGIESVGTSLGGFILGSYIKWILNDALGRGIKKLYFIARDGYVLKKIADTFIEKMGYNISTKYLYGSRKAWRMAAQISEDMDVLKLYHSSTPEFLRDLKSVADIFEITFFELSEFLPKGLGANYRLSRLDTDVLFKYLDEYKEFKIYLAKKNKEKRKMVLAYLGQEIDLQEREIAFVEVGGTGYTQKCLENILSDIYDGHMSTYFFQLYSIQEGQDNFFNFIPDGLYIKDAIEPLCRAPHGQTLGYVQKSGHIEPILEGQLDLTFFENNYEKYIKGLSDYENVYMDLYKEIFFDHTNRKLVRKCWDYYTHVRDEQILDFIGEVPFEVTGMENKKSTYAPKLDQREIKDIFCTYKTEPVSWHYKGASLNMSILRMSDEDRDLMEKYQKKTQLVMVQKNNHNGETTYGYDTFIRIPAGRYPKGTKIVIYGAGMFGKAFYYHEKRVQEYQIALWVDRQYLKYEKQGYPVVCPDRLSDTEYDIVLFAVLDENVKNSIKKGLLQMCIPEEKMDWISPKELVEGYSHE